MTNRPHSLRRHGKWLVVAPAVAATAVALTACSNSEESAPADSTYTLPAPFTGAPAPDAVNGEEQASGASEAGTSATTVPAKDTSGVTVTLTNAEDAQVGTVQLGDDQGSLTVDLTAQGIGDKAGLFTVGVTDNGACTAADGFKSAGQVRAFDGGETGTTLSLPVSEDGRGSLSTSIPGASVAELVAGEGSAVVVMDAQDARVACGVVEKG